MSEIVKLIYDVLPDAFVLAVWVIICYSFCIYFTKRGSLTVAGAVTACVMATLIIYFTYLSWLLPLLLFFASSILIGKLLPSRSDVADAKHDKPRDAVQVLANGGLYTLVALFGQHLEPPLDHNFFTDPAHYYQPMSLYCIAAIATADTWSSEVGQYFAYPTYDLAKFRRVPAGLSGGVSLPGTFAGLLGATFIALLTQYFPFYIPNTGEFIIHHDFFRIMFFGFFGMLIDSFLGSWFQATYRSSETGDLLETPGPGVQLYSGYRWITNDLVNVFAILLGWLLLLTYLYLTYDFNSPYDMKYLRG